MGWCCGLGELSRGGSPNVTGGCEKMGNWRSRSGQAILRECRAVGRKAVDIPEPGSQGLLGHLRTLLQPQRGRVVRAYVLTAYAGALVAW